jgi:hypothetical protein
MHGKEFRISNFGFRIYAAERASSSILNLKSAI